jgi:transcriptional regulator GlxA family with amidase domain
MVLAETQALKVLSGPFDLVLVAGGTEPGLTALRDSGLYEWLAHESPRARRVGSVCGGAFILARAGLLAGRNATTHWRATGRLQAAYPDVRVQPDEIFTLDGPVCTSAGVTAGIDLALALVEADHGASVAARIAQDLVVFLRRPGGQSQFSEALKAQVQGSSALRAALEEIQSDPAQDLSVTHLAALCAMSPRNFTRRFTAEIGTPPAAFVATARIDHARRLLLTTELAVASIAYASGFSSAEALTHAFRAKFGQSPSECRSRHRSAYRPG